LKTLVSSISLSLPSLAPFFLSVLDNLNEKLTDLSAFCSPLSASWSRSSLSRHPWERNGYSLISSASTSSLLLQPSLPSSLLQRNDQPPFTRSYLPLRHSRLDTITIYARLRRWGAEGRRSSRRRQSDESSLAYAPTLSLSYACFSLHHIPRRLASTFLDPQSSRSFLPSDSRRVFSSLPLSSNVLSSPVGYLCCPPPNRFSSELASAPPFSLNHSNPPVPT